MITLVIIGVIAAMTIPTLMNKTNKQEDVAKLKKVYSTLAQATNSIIAEEGLPRGDIGGWATDVDNVYNLYKKHLQISKDCGSASGCVPNGSYKHLRNTNTKNFNTYSNNRKFVLSDGTPIIIADSEGVSQNCSNTTEGATNYCFVIITDINGQKGPKAVGRDLFSFVVKEDGLYPSGCDVADSCTQSSMGYGCTCKVIRENAMNY